LLKMARVRQEVRRIINSMSWLVANLGHRRNPDWMGGLPYKTLPLDNVPPTTSTLC